MAVKLLDSAINELRKEISFVKNYDKTISIQMENYSTEIIQNQTEYLKVGLIDAIEGAKSISKLVEQLEEFRIRVLEQFFQNSTVYIKKQLLNPFWIGMESSTIDIIDELSNFSTNDKYLQSNNQDKLVCLKSNILKFEEFIKKFKRENDIAKVRVPSKVIIWGIPIWVGIFLSDRFSLLINVLTLLTIPFIAVISFFVLKRRNISNQNNINNSKYNIKSLTTFFSKRSFPITIILQIFFFLTIFLLMLNEPITKLLSGDPLAIEYTINHDAVSGETIIIPISISSKSQDLYKFTASISSKIINGSSIISVPIVSNKKINSRLILKIPADIPNGIYPYDLISEYKIQPKYRFIYNDYLTIEKKHELFVTVRNKTDSSKIIP